MTVLLVRHARAGERDAWVGDDRLRPLDAKGRRQAAALVDQLADFAIERILSSPYLRCRETVEPLARERGIEIEERDELGEERQWTDGVHVVRALGSTNAVVGGHGGLSDAIVGRGQKKAETIVLDVGPGAEPRVRDALRPPA